MYCVVSLHRSFIVICQQLTDDDDDDYNDEMLTAAAVLKASTDVRGPVALILRLAKNTWRSGLIIHNDRLLLLLLRHLHAGLSVIFSCHCYQKYFRGPCTLGLYLINISTWVVSPSRGDRNAFNAPTPSHSHHVIPVPIHIYFILFSYSQLSLETPSHFRNNFLPSQIEIKSTNTIKIVGDRMST